MITLFASLLIGQCAGGVCAVPPSFANLAPVTYAGAPMTYSSSQATYSSVQTYGAAPLAMAGPMLHVYTAAPPSGIAVHIQPQAAPLRMRFRQKLVIRSRGAGLFSLGGCP
jgi:hypothetical protein